MRHAVAPLLVALLACSAPAADRTDVVVAPSPPVVASSQPAPSTATTAPATTAPGMAPPAAPAPAAAPAPEVTRTPSPAPAPTPPLPPGVARPAWLHTIPLQLGPDGEALPAPTPPELVVRRIPTIDILPPPSDGTFRATVEPVPSEVLARSTWTPQCPVAAEDLRYVTVSFWGFDERPHTGELLVHAEWAEEVAAIFGELHAARYPIEEMRVVAAEELEGTPTGDTNNTSAFVCRPTRGSTSWSQHAYGLAVDVNPFLNPYQRGERILPELAGAYLDRSHVRPGMLAEGDVAVTAFDAIGWGWGGRWQSLIDWMHFSANGR